MSDCVLESFDELKKQVIQYHYEHQCRAYEVDFIETSVIDYPAFSVPIISGDLVVTFLFEESFSVAKKFVYRVGSCTSDGCVGLIGTIHKELKEGRPQDKRIRNSMSEFSENVCVMDVIPMTSDDVLVIDEAEFEPFEKLSKMGCGSLGLLTGMRKSELERQHVKSVLAEKVDKHLRDLVRSGCYVAIVSDKFISVYKE